MVENEKHEVEVERAEEDWPNWDELEFLPGIGPRRRSWIVEQLKKETEAKDAAKDD